MTHIKYGIKCDGCIYHKKENNLEKSNKSSSDIDTLVKKTTDNFCFCDHCNLLHEK